MRIADPRIRTVARAIGYRDAARPLHDHHALANGIYVWTAERRQSRRTVIAAAVRVLEALDQDIIDDWYEHTGGNWGFTIDGWVELPVDMRDDPPDRVHVTVRMLP